MKTGWKRNVSGELVYYTVEAFENTGLVHHCFTTRYGGVSTGDMATMNLGFHRGDKRENVIKNYDVICSEIGMNYKNLVLSNQVHEDKIRAVGKADCGKGIVRESDIIGIDGLMTNESGVGLATFYADCVPLMFLDPVKKVIASSHSGWRSTVLDIGPKTVAKMVKDFDCKAENILVGVGPSIGKCHFEVDEDVAVMFDKKYREKRGEKYHIDLWNMIGDRLRDAGILDGNITLAGLCTYCMSDEFFSNRVTKGKRGNLAAIMELI